MGKEPDLKDTLIAFERPLDLQSRLVYGLAYNKEKEKLYAERGSDLSIYIGYLTAVDYWERNGGKVENNEWIAPNDKYRFDECPGLVLLVSYLLRGVLKWEVYEIGAPIEILDGEVDEDDPYLITSPTLLDRYIQNTK